MVTNICSNPNILEQLESERVGNGPDYCVDLVRFLSVVFRHRRIADYYAQLSVCLLAHLVRNLRSMAIIILLESFEHVVPWTVSSMDSELANRRMEILAPIRRLPRLPSVSEFALSSRVILNSLGST